ncbi:MAG: YDG domain-containing protein [Clostridiales bacterium]|jgi:hypothetical protein|nr:YDG domain-containing protein [Clostridiales bacterium]
MRRNGKGLRFLVYFFVCVFGAAGAVEAFGAQAFSGLFGGVFGGLNEAVGELVEREEPDEVSAIDLGDGSDVGGDVTGQSGTMHFDGNSEIIAQPVNWGLADYIASRSVGAASGINLPGRARADSPSGFDAVSMMPNTTLTDKSEYSSPYFEGQIEGNGKFEYDLFGGGVLDKAGVTKADVGRGWVTTSIIYRINLDADMCAALKNGWLNDFKITVVAGLINETDSTYVTGSEWGGAVNSRNVGIYAQVDAPERRSKAGDYSAEANSNASATEAYTWTVSTKEEREKIADAGGVWVKVYAEMLTCNRYQNGTWIFGGVETPRKTVKNMVTIESVSMSATYNKLPAISFVPSPAAGGQIGNLHATAESNTVNMSTMSSTLLSPAVAYATAIPNEGYYFQNWTLPDTDRFDDDDIPDFRSSLLSIYVSPQDDAGAETPPVRWIDITYRGSVEFVYKANFVAIPPGINKLENIYNGSRQGPELAGTTDYPLVAHAYSWKEAKPADSWPGSVWQNDGGKGKTGRPTETGEYVYTATLSRDGEVVGYKNYDFTIEKASLTVNSVSTLPKTYDGQKTLPAAGISVVFDGLYNSGGQRTITPVRGLDGDYIIYSAELDAPEVGNNRNITVVVEITDTLFRNYYLTESDDPGAAKQAKVVSPSTMSVVPAEVSKLNDLYFTYGDAFVQQSLGLSGTPVTAEGVVVSNLPQAVKGSIRFSTTDTPIPVRPTVALDGASYRAIFVPDSTEKNYKASTVLSALPITIHVAKKALTVTDIKAADKLYDGTKSVSVSDFEFGGLVYGENLTPLDYKLISAEFVGADAGESVGVVAEFELVQNAVTANYKFEGDRFTFSGASAKIKKVDLQISAKLTGNNSKVYDGTRNASAELAVTGLVNGEKLVAGEDYIITAEFRPFAAIGLRMPIDVTFEMIDPELRTVKNYNYNQEKFIFYGAMTRKTLTVKEFTVNDKYYDGTDVVGPADEKGNTLGGYTLVFDGFVPHFTDDGKLPSFRQGIEYFVVVRFQQYAAGAAQSVRAAYGFTGEFTNSVMIDDIPTTIDYRNFYQFSANGAQNGAAYTTAAVKPMVLDHSALYVPYGDALPNEVEIPGVTFTGRPAPDVVKGTIDWSNAVFPNNDPFDPFATDWMWDVTNVKFTPAAGTKDYAYSDNLNLRVQVVPRKINITVYDKTITYDGTAQKVEVKVITGVNDGYTFNTDDIILKSITKDNAEVELKDVVGAGEYIFTYELKNPAVNEDYFVEEGKGTLTIEKKPIPFKVTREDGLLIVQADTSENLGDIEFKLLDKDNKDIVADWTGINAFEIENDKTYEIEVRFKNTKIGANYEALVGTVEPLPEKDNTAAIVIGVIAGVVALAGGTTGAVIAIKKKKQKEEEEAAAAKKLPLPVKAVRK